MINKRRGRPDATAKHIRTYRWEFESAAYRYLSLAALALLSELKHRYTGENNGHIVMSVREAATRLGRHKNSMTPVFEQLIETGFIRPRKKGSFNLKARHATEWILTEFPVANQIATKDFMAWRPADETGKVIEIGAAKRKIRSQK